MERVFISYSRNDLDFVERLAKDLKASGFDVWYDLSELKGGDEWRKVIEEAIQYSQFFVIVLSTNSAGSSWVEREFLYAESLKLKIIPLLYAPSKLPMWALDLQCIDMQGSNYELGYTELLRALKIGPQEVLKQLKNKAIQYESNGDFWNALQIYYQIKKIDPLFPFVDIKILELEKKTTARKAPRPHQKATVCLVWALSLFALAGLVALASWGVWILINKPTKTPPHVVLRSSTSTPTRTPTTPSPPKPTFTPTHTTPPPAPTPILLLDLMDYASGAVWEGGQEVSGQGFLNTVSLLYNDPNEDHAQSGWAGLYHAKMENGKELTVLYTHPMWAENGCIKGWFKNAWIEIPENAYFYVEVGFLEGAGGEVTFQVFEHHLDNNGYEVIEPIIQHDKSLTGQLDPLKIDLSYLAGKQVYFELRVDAGPSGSGQDWAVWYLPSVWKNP